MTYAGNNNSTSRSPKPICVPVKTAFALLSISHTKGYELLNSGALESTIVGGRRMVFSTSINAYAEAGRETGKITPLTRGGWDAKSRSMGGKV